MKYRIQDTFDTTPSRYWEVFFDHEYCGALFEHIRQCGAENEEMPADLTRLAAVKQPCC